MSGVVRCVDSPLVIHILQPTDRCAVPVRRSLRREEHGCPMTTVDSIHLNTYTRKQQALVHHPPLRVMHTRCSGGGKRCWDARRRSHSAH